MNKRKKLTFFNLYHKKFKKKKERKNKMKELFTHFEGKVVFYCEEIIKQYEKLELKMKLKKKVIYQKIKNT